jgi:lipoprotein-anchoring transpeptidase ErfK/SrfK
MRRELAGLVLLAVATLSGCAAQAAAGQSPTKPTEVHESPSRAAGGPPMSTLPESTDNFVQPAPPPPPPPCGPEIRACVSLSTKQAWLLANGAVELGPVPITHGGTTSPTPTGTWPVAWKDQEHTSSIYGDPMPYSVFFAPGGYAFHEGRLDEDSHGCVRLEMANAQTFFNTLQVGQLVQVVA